MTSPEFDYTLAITSLILMSAALIYAKVRPSSAAKKRLRLRTRFDQDGDPGDPAVDLGEHPAAPAPEVSLKLPRRKRE